MEIPRLVSFPGFAGGLSWICEADSHLGFLCMQQAVINGVNLIFLCFFYLFLLITFRNRNNPTRESRRNYVSILVSLCCAVISSAYFIAGLMNLTSKNDRKGGFVCLISGLVWTSFAASLLVKWSYSIIILSSIWWVCSFLVVSALNTLILVRHVRIELLDLISWPVSFLLLVCAFINFYHFLARDTRNDGLSQSLLDKEDKIKRPVNFFSKLIFSWMNPLLSLGYRKPLALNDIPTLNPEDKAELAYQSFSNVWVSFLGEKNLSNNRNLIFHVISKVYRRENMFIAILALSKTISVVASPLILYFFINYSNGDGTNVREGLTIVGCLIISKVVESLCQRHWFFESRRSGMRMRSALMVAIYQKQLKLSSLGRKRHSTGEIVNYIAVDAYRIGEFPWWFHLAWSSSSQLFLAIGVLFGVVGMGALLGLIPLIICGLLNLPFAKILQKCQSEFMIGQDERLRFTSEILNSMKIIKLQSWGEKFKSLIESRRDAEFKWLAEAQFKKVYSTLLYWTSPTIVSSVVFCGYILFGGSTLSASTIFTVLATLRSMSEPVRMIPEALSIMIQVKVSLHRINAFLLDDELKADGMWKNRSENSYKSVVIESGNFSWDLDAMIPTLRDVNFDMKFGEKIAVCGQVGAGKSSFLHAVLGEIPKLSGKVHVFGSIAYVSQTAWIQSGTIRENILFGKPMEIDRYEMVIKACALDKDISNFDHGDLTEIGQRGINMSGGQKQRIQLARAVYNDADIYLLDDPFSAVDAHTAATLFNDCVMTALHKKTVILVTHQVEFLAEVDKILVLEGGRIAKSGSYEELLTAGTALEKLVNAHKSAITALNPSNRVNSPSVITAEDFQGSYMIKEQHKGDKGQQPAGQLTEEEEKEIGDVGWKPFWDYIGIANGSFVLWLGIISQVCFTILQAVSTYWLALAIQFPQITNGMLIGIYTAISSLSTVFIFLRSYFGAQLGLKASKAFFSGFTDSIFAAPMSFFDSTPVGRILTRASSDLSILDFDISFSIVFIVAGGIELLVVIGIMAAVTWQVLIVGTFALVGSHYLQGYYLASARELMRINGTTKAPLMNYAAETSLGLVTIRAFGMAERFFCNFLKLVDTDASLFFHSNAATEWLLLRVEALQNLTLFTAAFLLVLLPNSNLNPGLVGLSLSYALSLTLTQIFVTKWYCSLSNYIISVERIKQFMHLPSEPPAVVEDNRPPCSWPSKGRIELESLKIRYRPNSSLVLNGISCVFDERSRVGIVGRTGSGKTTLISALFRLVDPASGRIVIDGIDICSIGLKDLRMKLSIIPQEATLFRGSVRTNLDPLGLYSDEELWKALEKCQLKETISSLPNQLDSHVSDEGENWSAGQRQLFCLGRVLLRRNRILVLDEATASIDSATDATLQRIIREEFSDCTVLTVAHRVPTVIDSDKVLVLSFGKVVEYEEPWKLMESNQSSFSKLVAEYWSSCRRNSHQNLNRH